MAIDQRLNTKQTQTMVMTPRLQESIKILQMSMVDLASYITQELEQNPFLDKDDINEKEVIEDSFGSEAKTDEYQVERALADGPSEAIIEDSPGDGWDDEAVSSAVFESTDSNLIYHNATSGGGNFGDDRNSFENISSAPLTLKEYVIDQINVDITDSAQRLIAMHLVDCIDDNGYLTSDFSELALILKCDIAEIEKVLKILQSFDPPGVFSRNVAECIALQLKDKNRFDPAMERLVDHIDLLAKYEFKKLQKICDVSDEDFKEMCLEVKALNPRPGLQFSPSIVEAVQPDVFLSRSSQGGWHLELNIDALPKVLVNRRYFSEISEQTNDNKSKKFITEQLTTANWLVKALDQRANTILKVATEIVDQQAKFFESGICYLKPLILEDIATAVDIHESTVSRVINGKYIATHIGLYELKYFFSSNVKRVDGDDQQGAISSKVVKHMIKSLISNETANNVLSDERIALSLQEQGIDVARRTVMKYREAMSIPSSVQRKREYRRL